MRYFLLFIVGLFSFLGGAQADCTVPAGVEGDQIFNSTYKVMQFCDGTNWYSMKGGVKHTLDILSCADGELAKWNSGGGVWECAGDDDSGVSSESDPTVLSSVKDGVSWAEVTGKPAGFADDIDHGITSESDPQVGTLINGKWCTTNGTSINCTSDAPGGGGVSYMDYTNPTHGGYKLGGTGSNPTTINQYCIGKGYSFGILLNYISVLNQNQTSFYSGAWTQGYTPFSLNKVRCVN